MTETCDRCGPAVRAAYRASRIGQLYPVSYTHLTLPTICSV